MVCGVHTSVGAEPGPLGRDELSSDRPSRSAPSSTSYVYGCDDDFKTPSGNPMFVSGFTRAFSVFCSRYPAIRPLLCWTPVPPLGDSERERVEPSILPSEATAGGASTCVDKLDGAVGNGAEIIPAAVLVLVSFDRPQVKGHQLLREFPPPALLLMPLPLLPPPVPPLLLPRLSS